MKTTHFLTLSALFIFLTLSFLPTSFAQDSHPDPIVRLIYFLPNDREAQPDIDAILDGRIKKAQKFFADAMAAHGYGRKTFAFESDANGNAIVHHVNGIYDDVYYQSAPTSKIIKETQEQFDFTKNIYYITVEISSDTFDDGAACGYGGGFGYGGQTFLPRAGSCFEGSLEGIDHVAHELGHAFGLQHNFRNFTYIMSYGWGRTKLSPCFAEWLNVHPYFNSDKVLTRNYDTQIKLLSSRFDASPPHALRLRFEITDPDGLHQAQLLTHTTGSSVAGGFPEFVDCQTLSKAKEVVEFVTTELLNEVEVFVIDTQGNYIRESFIIDYEALAPESETVRIPDVNLASAIRTAFDYAPGTELTKFDMARLPHLNASRQNVKDLTGLEHAVNLKYLRLGGNPIRDLTPLLALQKLTTLVLSGTSIDDLTQLAEMTQLTNLGLGSNDLSDISALAGLTQLTQLILGYNDLSDISALAGLTQLEDLGLNHNQISDISPLKNLTRLERLNLQYNQIIDIRPLKRLVRLWNLYIDNNPLIDDITALTDMTEMRFLQLPSPLLTDITPLSRMTQLVELFVGNNEISDITPLADATQLRSLTLGDNPITNITPLSRMTQLVELGLWDCQINDITPLAELTQLELLSLAGNQITDIRPLTRLTKLKGLSLASNQISDMRPLLSLPNLNSVSVWGNPITDRQPLLTLLRRNPKIKIYHHKGGEPLPVRLSSFKAVRTADGAAIHWTTESEVDNAGFYIYRSQTKDGEYTVVNPKLIQGAGTTGERSTYTWTDTSAKPNTVYYYRIEDVSHAGVRQPLATVRLRGLVSASDKLMTRWADLKASQ